MPRSILKIVAVIIGLCAIGGFVMGVLGTPPKGHLPGEANTEAPSAPLTASELLPLNEETPPPPEKPKADEPEEKPKDVAPVSETTPTEAPAVPAPIKPPPVKPAPVEDRVGDLLDGVTPPPQDEPPH